jgi:hypothetical protein
MVERLSAAGQHITLPDAIMITGTDDHDPPETMITINWIERSRWSGIGDHDRPECAPTFGLPPLRPTNLATDKLLINRSDDRQITYSDEKERSLEGQRVDT